MALGAQRRNILANVLVEGLVMAAIGVSAGVVLGFGLRVGGRQIRYGDSPAGRAGIRGISAHHFGSCRDRFRCAAARAANVNAVEALRAE